MTILGKVADAAAFALIQIAGLSRPSAWSTRIADRLSSMRISVSDEFEYLFAAYSPLLLWRARTLLHKEPETIAWIRSFSRDDVFFDIGANVGIFTVYAGRRGARVFAFEPESANFVALNRNIALNKLSERVMAFPVAISERMRVDSLRLASINPGAALHSFGTNLDFKGDAFVPVFEQGCLAISLDELVTQLGLPQPTRIKIDVDGLERKIIEGASKVINDPRLRDILVEINENDPGDQDLIRSLEDSGFCVIAQGSAVTDAEGKFRMSNLILRRSER